MPETTEAPISTALATTQPQTIAGLVLKTASGIAMAKMLEEQTEQRQILGLYVKRNMVAGTDYGVIPGTKENTLLKPGAEKLVDLFRCSAEFELTERIEEWDRDLFQYEFKCTIRSRDTGAIVAQGVGSANSYEGKWRWRNSSRKCPNCGKETIIKGKAEFGGGWLCFAKKGGCNAKWKDGAPEIEKQEVGRVENDDIASLVNTVLKIAKKRALVDGAVALARCSDLFTQDMEDTPAFDHGAPPDDGEPTHAAPAASRPQAAMDAPASQPEALLQDPAIAARMEELKLTPAQRTLRLRQAGGNRDKLCQILGIQPARGQPSSHGASGINEEEAILDQIAGCTTDQQLRAIEGSAAKALPRLEKLRPGATQRIAAAADQRHREIALPNDNDDIPF